MGLAASQARLLLLTAKNDALELAAQKIEQERLILAQEQETIAQEYSDATSNTILTCRVTNEDGSTGQETLTLESLAKSLNSSGTENQLVAIANSNGEVVASATATRDEDGNWSVIYYDANGEQLDSQDPGFAVDRLNDEGSSTPLQMGLGNGGFQLLIQAPNDTNTKSTALVIGDNKGIYQDKLFVRKSTDSLDSVTSRYYTEDDAEAQAKYNTAMARVNALDTRLENKLNQVETQKKAVEQEMESVDSIVSSNIERTFQYFS